MILVIGADERYRSLLIAVVSHTFYRFFFLWHCKTPKI